MPLMFLLKDIMNTSLILIKSIVMPMNIKKDNPDAINLYRGEYMIQYPWAIFEGQLLIKLDKL